VKEIFFKGISGGFCMGIGIKLLQGVLEGYQPLINSFDSILLIIIGIINILDSLRIFYNCYIK